MQHYRALVEYDGSTYSGFQRQREGLQTIQGELEKAIGNLVFRPTTVIGAGRTDSGVHASGQVIKFNAEWKHGLDALQRAINAKLPADIVILQINKSSPTFHPRFDALRREYIYQVFNEPVRSPLKRLNSWHVRQPLDVLKMNHAARHIIGQHDFATFGRPPQGENTVREVFHAQWYREEGLIKFRISANAFLYRMVRSLVGSMKWVGDGSWTEENFVEAFKSCQRGRSGTAAPPHGLFLVSVTYDA